MRVAFFSPLPPARSGIADYSEALIESSEAAGGSGGFLRRRTRPSIPRGSISRSITSATIRYHGFVYETALRHPGVVVMHESNLHHLIADLTIKRGDWDAYLRECEYKAAPTALAFARARAQRWKSGRITKACR